MSFTLHGIGITDRIITGHAVLSIHDYSSIEKKYIKNNKLENECLRFKNAVKNYFCRCSRK